MKYTILFLFFSLVFCSFAEEERTIGDYSADVRKRIVAKVTEALVGDGKAEVAGIVTYVGDEFFFIQKESDGLKILSSGAHPAVGDDVRVVGKPSLEGGRIVFVATTWNCLGRAHIPAARRVTAADLVDADVNRLGVNGTRVVVEGRAMGVTEGGFVINVDDVPVNVRIAHLPDFIEDCEKTHPKVRIVGIAELMIDTSVFFGQDGYVMGVKLDVSHPEDIELLPDIPYLIARRNWVVSVVGLMLILLLTAGVVMFAIVILRQRRGIFRTQTIMAERKRMADDIHDTIEQHLVGAGMLLKMNRIHEAQDVLVRAKREIRDIVWGLKNDDMMRLSPAEMLRKLAHEETTKGIYRVNTRLEGLPAQMSASHMRDLSLIVRETIGNAVRHGGAKHIALSSDPLEGGGWRLRISNDGEPFDPATAPGMKEGHFGIEGMKQRAFRLGASFVLQPSDKGVVLILEKRI